MSIEMQFAIAADIVFDGAILRRNCAVVIEGARILHGGPTSELPAKIATRHLPRGAWLAPGFIDTQVNGGGDVLFNDEPSPEGIAPIAAAHRQFGTTALLPTLLSDTPEKMRAARNAVVAVADIEPSVIGVHYEGPFLSPIKPGIHDKRMIRCPKAGDVDLLITLRAGATL